MRRMRLPVLTLLVAVALPGCDYEARRDCDWCQGGGMIVTTNHFTGRQAAQWCVGCFGTGQVTETKKVNYTPLLITIAVVGGCIESWRRKRAGDASGASSPPD